MRPIPTFAAAAMLLLVAIIAGCDSGAAYGCDFGNAGVLQLNGGCHAQQQVVVQRFVQPHAVQQFVVPHRQQFVVQQQVVRQNVKQQQFRQRQRFEIGNRSVQRQRIVTRSR